MDILFSIFFIAVLFLLRKIKNQSALNAIILFLLSILVDIGLQFPLLSSVVSIYGLFCYFLNKEKNKVVIYVLLGTMPVCILFGVLIQEITLYQAEKLRNSLSNVEHVQELEKRFSEYCHSKPKGYCGNFSYRIFLIKKEKIETSYLLVWKFFGRQEIIPLVRHIHIHTNPDNDDQYPVALTAKNRDVGVIMTGLHENAHRKQNWFIRTIDGRKEDISFGAWSWAQDEAELIIENNPNILGEFRAFVEQCRKKRAGQKGIKDIDLPVEHSSGCKKK